MELACDEKVIRNWNNRKKATYMEALLSCSVQRHIGSSCPLAFGEIGVKQRVKAIMHYKKPAFWIVISAIVACIGIAICFLTNPIGSSIQNPYVQEYESGSATSIGNVDKEMFERISKDFSIGADKYGRAVFKNPKKAFDTLQKQYELGIELIEDDFDLAPLSHKNYSVYKKYGWQVTSGTQEAREQATFITKFLDIYENSFTKEIPKQTAQTTNPNSNDIEQNTQNEQQATSNPIINLPTEIVMVNGELYFYTDYENTITHKCGVMDGEITSTVNENEIPTKDNQSNFGVGYGYQYSTEGRIEVYRNDSWQIFATEEVWKKLQLHTQETTAFEDAISTTILEKYSNHVEFGNILVESHVVLANEVMSVTPKVGQTNHLTEETVYLLVLIQEYSAYDGTLVEVGGSYLPVAITLSTQNGTTYTVKEYWEPRDGAYHVKDIRSKFPGESAEDALTKQQDYIKALEAECYLKALAHLERVGTLDFQISDALDKVVFEMAKSSDTNATIPTQLADYQTLISYGAYTLRYCFSEFLQETQTDLQYSREYVMANVCQEIALAWGEAILFPDTNPSGKEWFNAFVQNAKELSKQYTKEDLEKTYPASFLLLQMMQE